MYWLDHYSTLELRDHSFSDLHCQIKLPNHVRQFYLNLPGINKEPVSFWFGKSIDLFVDLIEKFLYLFALALRQLQRGVKGGFLFL